MLALKSAEEAHNKYSKFKNSTQENMGADYMSEISSSASEIRSASYRNFIQFSVINANSDTMYGDDFDI